MRSIAFAAAVSLLALTACKGQATAEPLGHIANPPGAQNWSHAGPYAGITVGYSSQVFEAATLDLGSHGAFAGGYLGFGGIVNGMYLGIEGDATLRDVKGKMADSAFSVTASNNYLASIRARAGLPVGHTLLYITGGPAWTDTKLKATDGFVTAEERQSMLGLAAGAGIEAYITPTMHIRLEGLHYVFPDKKLDFSSSDAVKLGQQETVIRVGLGFKLN